MLYLMNNNIENSKMKKDTKNTASYRIEKKKTIFIIHLPSNWTKTRKKSGTLELISKRWASEERRMIKVCDFFFKFKVVFRIDNRLIKWIPSLCHSINEEIFPTVKSGVLNADPSIMTPRRVLVERKEKICIWIDVYISMDYFKHEDEVKNQPPFLERLKVQSV